MSRVTTRRSFQRQSSAPSSPAVPSPPRTPTTPTISTTPRTRAPLKTSSSYDNHHPSLGREPEEDGKACPSASATARQRQKPQLQKDKVTRVADEANPISPELARWIRLNAQDLKIRQRDRNRAVELVNHFRDSLLNFLKHEHPYFQSAEFFGSGSYYEMVKIHSPDEFDMMLKLQAPSRLDMIMLDNGLFYQLDLFRPTRKPIKAFLLENERTISASKILSEMHRLVRKFIHTYKAPDACCRWVVNRKRPNSPAVTLSVFEVNNDSEELLSVDVVPALEVPSEQGWPQAARDGPDVDNWLGKRGRRKITSSSCFFVPKRPKGRNLSEAAKESWRISFSHIEKDIIKVHGNKKTCCESTATKCCRKQCFKLLKCLIEGLKQRFPQELDALCSYHGKTVFLHTLSIRYEDSLWACHQLPASFMHLLGSLEDHARSSHLPHFFVPNSNLFDRSAFPRKALAFLAGALEEQRREGLPLLKPPAPALLLAKVSCPVECSDSLTSSTNSSPASPQAQVSPVAMVNFLDIGFTVRVIMMSFVIVLISALLLL